MWWKESFCTASNTAAAAAADVPVSGCTAGGARVGAGVKVGRVGRESEGSLRSGMLMDTAGKDETDEDMRLKNESEAFCKGGAGAPLDAILGPRTREGGEEGGRCGLEQKRRD